MMDMGARAPTLRRRGSYGARSDAMAMRWRTILAAAILLAGTVAWSQNWVKIQLDYDDFGHVQNRGNLCAPTATINSFRFLENTFPSIYGNSLTRGDIEAARDELAQFMNSDETNGTTIRDMWNGKIRYLEHYAPGKTMYGGQLSFQNFGVGNSWLRTGDLTDSNPTFNWMWDQLTHKEDVELGIWWDDGLGHVVTLTSLAYDDANGDGMRDELERMRIDYLDPNDPSGLKVADLFLQGDLLTFGYNDQIATIEFAFKESPVPEPTTIMVSLTGLGLAWMRRRRVR